MVMEMIRAGEVKEDNENYRSTLDILFERLESRNPEHIALKYYRSYHSGSAKTLKSIQITLISRLEKFNLECIIFSVFASSPPDVDTTAAAASMVWSYIGELIFNMLILVGSVKMADRIVREMMGL